MSQRSLMVNDVPCSVVVDEQTTLLDVLRDQLHLTGTKNGCGEGHCGACTVIVDGQARRACLVRGRHIRDGMRIETIEGLARDSVLNPLQQAFIDEGAVQCGFCTPGLILAAQALLNQNPHPSDAEIQYALRNNLCRCTGYAAILRAVHRAAGDLVEPPIESQTPLQTVGRARPRPDAIAKVTGAALYTADLYEQGMLYAVVHRSNVPHATVRSLDVAQAAAMPGVVRVLTAADIPGEHKHGLIRRDWPTLVGVGERVRYLGDALAVALAKSEAQARAAAAAVQVEYELQPVIDSPQAALREGMPALHDGGNVMHEIRFGKGDVTQGFAQADLVMEHVYRTPTQEHAFLEPEASLAVPQINTQGQVERITVYVGSQIPFEDRRQIAETLAWSVERVRVIGTAVGGTYGGKEDIAAQIHAALGVYHTGRPVKLVFTRRESFLVHPKRHATTIRLKTAMNRDGRLLAVQAYIDGDTGAYASLGIPVMTRTATHITGPYDVPHVEIVSRAIYTNNAPAGAFRGFGVPQASFAVERQMDRMAAALNLDPVQVRRQNVLRQGSTTATGQVIRNPIGMAETLERVVQEVEKRGGWAAIADGDCRRAWGLACGYKNVGLGGGIPDRAAAYIEARPDGRVWVGIGAAEVGQGLVQIAAAIAAETLQIPLERVDVTVADTDITPDCGPTTASRQTFISGNAVRLAAETLRERLNAQTDLAEWDLDRAIQQASELGLSLREEVVYTPPQTAALGRPGDMHFSFGYATQAALVEVNLRTGQARVLEVIAAQDVGRVLNPLGLRGQIEGGVVMGLGLALYENMAFEQGQLMTPTLAQYHIPRITEMPQMTTIYVECQDPNGPFGGKGVGELSLIPTPPAVANAIARAARVQLDELPATPERILNGLRR